MPLKRYNPSILVIIAGMVSLALISGCGGEKHEYVEVQEVEKVDPHAGHDHSGHDHAGHDHAAHEAVASVPTPENPGFSYTVPEAWEVMPPSRMVLLTFQASAAERTDTVNISSSAFPGEVGGKVANINRWRRQIGLGPVEEAEAIAMIQPLTISGKEAWQVTFNNDTAGAQMVVSAVFHDGKTWFFKMVGMAEPVGAQLENYNSYLGSIQFN